MALRRFTEPVILAIRDDAHQLQGRGIATEREALPNRRLLGPEGDANVWFTMTTRGASM